MRSVAVILLVTLAAGACRARAEQSPKSAAPNVAWHALGSFSGYGNQQTESFNSDTGTLRVRWEATSPNGAPAFRLTAYSAISGRLLQQVTDQVGAPSGVGYVQQNPHVFYMVVEAPDADWKFTVDDAIVYP